MLNCCICCEAPADLGCFVSCELTTETAAPVAGEYTLRAKFKGAIIEIKTEALAGEILVFDMSKLNEDFSYIAEILDPSGAVVAVGGAECFSFRRITAAGVF